MSNDTTNDESIAQALADAEYAHQLQSEENSRRWATSSQVSGVPQGRIVSGSYPGLRSVRSVPHEGNPAIHTPVQQTPRPPQPTSMLSAILRPRVQMCHVPCIVGSNNICVEMMIDTGAEKSVMSLALCRRLGLEASIDRRQSGIANGVGQARILGNIAGVVCTMGHVEFPMDFMVLEVPGQMLLLGMDQMRKYNCIVDISRDVLIFGGSGGVEVPFLPPDQQSEALRHIRESCTIS